MHWKQQREARSRLIWFLKYAVSWGFRRAVELEAYRVTVNYYVNHFRWTPVVKVWMVNELSGWTYLKMMSRREAEKWVTMTVTIIKKEG